MLSNRETLRNDLLELVPLLSQDFELLYVAGSDPEIWAQHPDKTRYTPVGFTHFFQKLLATELPYLIIDKASQHVIGATSFYQYDPANKTVAIGYTFLAKSYWGGKFNSSLKKLMLTYAFTFVDKVYFHVAAKNLRSQSALTKIGAIKESEEPAPADPTSMQYTYVIYKNQKEA